MSNKRVIGGAEVDEPVPAARPEEDGHCVEGGTEHGWPTVGDEIRLPHDPDIAGGPEHRVSRHEPRELGSLSLPGAQLEVDEVEVGRVVEGPEETRELHGVAPGCRDQISEGDGVGGVGPVEVGGDGG